MKARISKTAKGFLVKPPFNPGTELKAAGGIRNAPLKGWLFPPIKASVQVVSRLYHGAVDIDPEVLSEIASSPDQEAFESILQSVLPGKVFNTLEGYQKEALEYLYNTRHPGALLTLSPGLGKTLTALAHAHLSKAKRVLIVCPASLTETWRRELEKWFDSKAQIVKASEPFEQAFKIVITNFEALYSRGADRWVPHPKTPDKTLRKYLNPKWRQSNWDLLIVDESLRIKNRNSQTTEALKELRKKATFALALSGSPVAKYLDDLYAQFNFLFPKYFTSYWRFAKTYCHVEKTQWGEKVVGSKDIEFPAEFSDLMFVRNKRDVLNLPENLYEFRYGELYGSQQARYNKALQEFILQLESGDELPIATKVAQLTRLQQIVSHPANVDPAYPAKGSVVKLDLLENLLEDPAFEKPAIIWYHWRHTGTAISECLQARGISHVQVAGGDKAKFEKFEAYQSGQVDAIVLSLNVGKYGLSFTNTQSVVFYEKIFDADAFVQALERHHRRGLDHPVTVYTLQVSQSIDELVAENLTGKSASIAKASNQHLIDLLGAVNERNPL